MCCKRVQAPRRDAANRNRVRRTALRSLGLACSLATAMPAAADTAEDSDSRRALRASLTLDADAIELLRGGLARGGAWDALARFELQLDGIALGLPQGSRLQASVARTQGEPASSGHVGDAQGVSNIEADTRSRVYECWYAQPGAAGWLWRAGLIAADAHFDTLDAAEALLNGSFGAQPTWVGNTRAPVFPTAGVGLMASREAAPWSHRIGVFQADPAERSSALRRGALIIEQSAWQGVGSYKLGGWLYRPHGAVADAAPAAGWGLYASAEYPLRAGAAAPRAFLRVGWSPPQDAPVAHDLQFGLLVPGPLRGRADDRLSVGIAHAALRGQRAETAYEVAYRLVLSRHVALQPDLQYVRHPGGRPGAALVAMLRLHLAWE